MSALTCEMPLLRTCSQISRVQFVPTDDSRVRLNRSEAAVVVRRIAKIDDVLASHYHVRGSDVRFRWQILKERDQLVRLLKDGHVGNLPLDQALQFSPQTVEATLDYARTITTYSYSAMYGVREGFEQLTKKLNSLVR
jgi:hypothetical protein